MDLTSPPLALVGAPNVGKSSLVRTLSSGKPEVCNYPFTTRGISVGHIGKQPFRHQVKKIYKRIKKGDYLRLFFPFALVIDIFVVRQAVYRDIGH